VLGFTLAVLVGLCVFPALILAALVPGLLLLRAAAAGLGGYWYLALAPVVAVSFVVLFCLEVALLKWALLGRVRPGRHRLYGWFHARKWFVDHLLDMVLNILLPLHTSLYQVPWYRLLGARIGRHAELSTATQVVPDLVRVGAGGFIADNVSLGAPRVEAGYLTLAETRVGDRTFIGNSAVVPAGAEVGDRCLVGCLSTVPPEWAGERSRAPGRTWLGSPAFSLPQRQQPTEFPEEQTFRPTTKLFVQRALVEAARIVGPLALVVLVTLSLLAGLVELGRAGVAWWVVLLLLPLLQAGSAGAVMLLAVALKWLVMGRYVPRERPLWSPFVWGSELVSYSIEWLGNVYFLRLLLGTPFVCWYFRLLGARIGRRVYMDTPELTEFDLVEIGDDAALNDRCTIQTHLFEDRVMKMSYVRIGERCSVGAGATVLYDTCMGTGSVLEELSLLMKGEVLPAWTAWTGIPAVPADKVASPRSSTTPLPGPFACATPGLLELPWRNCAVDAQAVAAPIGAG
jgi:non-ribosomal peptide synthetase-like protein